MIVNFKEKAPEFGVLKYDEKAMTTKNPHEIFANQKKSKGSIIFDMKCCCTDSDCQSRIMFMYSGLNRYIGSRNLGSDTEIAIHPESKKEEGRANNVWWNPSEDNVGQFVDFAETAREAVAFKLELLTGLYAELKVRIKGYDEIQIMVRKEETEIRFILFEIPNTFPKVPLLREAESYRECLGVIATLPPDTDTREIKNDYADMINPFFAPIIAWVNLLGVKNQLDLVISSIWVMPE